MTPDKPEMPSRAHGLDLARGLAVVAMVFYHFSWDLSHFGLIETDVGLDPLWKRFAQTIAASFLFIAGVSLAFAARDGLNRRRFFRRLGILVAAALGITVATYVAFPDRFIFFGILHSIAVASVLALPFVGRHWIFAAVAASGVFLLAAFARDPLFNHPTLIWLGLGTAEPLTNDFVPVLPWSGFLLAGLATGTLWHPSVKAIPQAPQGFLAKLGRWSLPIYLLHQPLLFGAFTALGATGLLTLSPEVKPFVQSCAADCETSGAGYGVCTKACACVARTLRDRPVWRKVIADRLDDEDRQELSLVGRRCYQAANPAAPLTSPAKEGP